MPGSPDTQTNNAQAETTPHHASGRRSPRGNQGATLEKFHLSVSTKPRTRGQGGRRASEAPGLIISVSAFISSEQEATLPTKVNIKVQGQFLSHFMSQAE